MQLLTLKLRTLLIAGFLLLAVTTQPVEVLADEATEVRIKAAATEPEPVITADEPEETEAIDSDVDGEAETKSDSTNDSVLTLDEAVERALIEHPGLASLDKEYWALDSIAWQEGRKPNPELELEFEEFGGTVDAQGIRALATSLTYTQSIERGGKRTRREVAAALEREVVLADMAELEHEIQAGVRTAFAEAQAAQYELVQLSKYRSLVQLIYATVATSVEAGRSAQLELERIDVELARLDLEQKVAELSLQQAYLSLAGSFGATSLDFSEVEFDLPHESVVPDYQTLLPLLDWHPALTRYDYEYEALCALLDLENANSIPDVDLFGGLTRLNENEETVFKIGVAFDLQLHERNEGNIGAAAWRLEQVEDNRALARLELETELAAIIQLASHALENYQSYGASLLPAANEAMELTGEGYRYGKFELLDLLDAQRTVLELETEQTAALMEYHLQLAEIEALLNISLNDVEPVTMEEEGSSTEPEVIEPLANEEHNHE